METMGNHVPTTRVVLSELKSLIWATMTVGDDCVSTGRVVWLVERLQRMYLSSGAGGGGGG
jgi:hypothetical protein